MAAPVVAISNDIEECKNFLEKFTGDGDEEPKYMQILQRIANRELKSLDIRLDDVDFLNTELAEKIERNTMHFLSQFSVAADQLMPQPTVDIANDDVTDTLMAQRRQAQDPDAPPDVHRAIPSELARRYDVHAIPREKVAHQPRAVRSIMASDIGHLCVVKGIVTRVSEVKPLVAVATYTCESCGSEIYQQVTGRTFTPLDACPAEKCRTNRTRGRLALQTRGSRFVRVQEMRLQELPDQVPVGHIPRSMTVMMRGEHARVVLPGDVVTVAGVFLPIPMQGNRSAISGLLAETFLETMWILQHKQRATDENDPPEELQERIQQLGADRTLYERLSSSIAPEIFGHADVKKSLLLLLVAGATRTLSDGMKLRGDINVCLMGDPGVAKSQLLRHIAAIAPRAVYTSGRGSSGAGLTAAVMRDPVTKEMVLEGGALVLADMGVCCIDEFDKMQDQDRTAIHEVMEQQTVSIAKAGITTTLNARTAVLAAANPQYGRYNVRRSPAENINMPAALLSRFDLLFLVLDKPDPEADRRLAEHVLYVHKHLTHPPLATEPLDPVFMRAYIAQARKHVPAVPADLNEFIVSSYVDLRKLDDRNFVVTARTLLCVLRLAQALARLRFSDRVTRDDVNEALRLLKMARASLEQQEGTSRRRQDPLSAIYNLIRDASDEQQSATVRIVDVADTARLRGFSEAQIQQCLEEYERINVWQISAGRDSVTFV